MAIDLFPLLKRLQVGSYENCVILTYTADLFFFEQVVLPIQRSGNCCNNVVVMDSRQYVLSLDTMGMLLHGLGKSYSVWPVSAAGAFHPKIILQTSDRGGRLIIGSGNLTARGFSTNWELFSEFTASSDTTTVGNFADVWKLIIESTKGATRAVQHQLEQMKATSGTLLSSEGNENWPRLLFSTPTGPSIITQLKSLIGKSDVRRLIIVAPFFDAQLRATRELEKEFGAKKIIAIVQRESVSLPGKVAKNIRALAVHEFVPPRGSKSGYLHAKAYILQTSTIEYVVWGSANCSLAALAGQGNYEAVLVNKCKLSEGIATLGLGPSLEKEQEIDPSQFSLTAMTSPRRAASLSINSAETDRGNITVLIAPINRFSRCTEGRLKLWSKGALAGELPVKRTDSVTFVGRLDRIKDDSSAICRLVLQDDTGELESTPAAVHFLEDIKEATLTRRQASLQRAVEAIRSCTFDWAKGLEEVCELVIKIGLQDNTGDSTRNDGARRIKEKPNPSVSKGKLKIGEYGDFVSDSEDVSEVVARGSKPRHPLEDVVAALRAQILHGVTKQEDAEDELIELDTWRYREESERDAAESGASEPQHELPELEDVEKERLRIHRIYIGVMKSLTQRYEFACREKRAIGTEEFLRLDAVNLLLLNGIGRHVGQGNELGAVLLPEDVMSEYLPVLATFFGRSRAIEYSTDETGPLMNRTQAGQSEVCVMNALRTTCTLLVGLMAHSRKHMQRTFDDEALSDWSHYVEIIAVRCLATIQRCNHLPSQEDIAETASHSTWLAHIESNTLVEVFLDVCRLARCIVRCEDGYIVDRPSHSSQSLSPGDWVCTASSGVTEVARVFDSHVEIAMIGWPDADKVCFKDVAFACIQRTNIPNKVRINHVSVAEGLNHLLTYSNEDFDEWRDLILPQLQRGYLTTLEKVAQGARSSKLRIEASRQLERNRTSWARG